MTEPTAITRVRVHRPGMSRWTMLGVVFCGSLLLSFVAHRAHVSPLWTMPVGLVLGGWTSTRWVRRKWETISAKPCPQCRKLPSMVMWRDGDAVVVCVYCSNRPACPVTAGVELKAAAPLTGMTDAELQHTACQHAAEAWSSDRVQTTLREQAHH